MPKLIIDDQEIEVAEGTKVIEAAERLGIMIPRFCYHPALGSVGACRVCAVKFLEGHHKGVDMSCMVEAGEGMIVSTTDKEAVQFRKYVIEWLMLNHPLDCPVCDEGGHCLLQDQTVSGGHGMRRYTGKKRTYLDQDLGPFIQHEMNRCIHCFRCRRFYQDFSGYRDLGVMQIGTREYFGRAESGALESPFSGNLIDICPTGVYTDKPARFKGRRWNFERAPSVCVHCSLGCSTTGSARYREMLRQEARFNGAVNGYFICDRGRFGFDFANHPDRFRKARVENQEVSWQTGIQEASDRINRVCRESGPEAVLCVGSTRCSLETQASIKRLCRLCGWPEPLYFGESAARKKVKEAVARLDGRIAVSLGQIENADFIIALGADPVNEAPMLALALRQAQRKGAAVAVLDPRPVSLPFTFSHLVVMPDHIDLYAAAIAKLALAGKEDKGLSTDATRFLESLPENHAQDRTLRDLVNKISRKLGNSKRPVFVCGTDIVGASTPVLAADLAHLFHQITGGAGLFYLLPGPNAFGAGLLSRARDQRSLVEKIETGEVKALLLVEQDLFRLCPDYRRLQQAMKRLECLIVLDYLPSDSAGSAQVVLPTATLFERTPSHFINQEGRVQKALPVHRGGTPICQVSGGGHPRRSFEDHVPGGDPRAAHEVLAELYSAVSKMDGAALAEGLWEWLAQEYPLFDAFMASPEIIRLVPDGGPPDEFSSSDIRDPGHPGEGMRLVLTDRTFGTEELSTYSRFAREVETGPSIFLHPDDAGRLGLSGGDKVVLHLGESEVVLDLHVAPNMAAGVVVVPRRHRVDRQRPVSWPGRVMDRHIHKA